MLDFETLLHQVKNQTKVIEVSADDQFDFVDREYAYIIESGSLLVVGERNSETGVSPTHTLEANDPIGFAEAIAVRPPKLKLIIFAPAFAACNTPVDKISLNSLWSKVVSDELSSYWILIGIYLTLYPIPAPPRLLFTDDEMIPAMCVPC